MIHSSPGGLRYLRLGPVMLLALLSLTPTALGEDPAPEDVARRKADLLFRLRVHRALDRGALWLLTLQQGDGSFRLEGNVQHGPFPESRHGFGETALVTYTLAHCGLGPERREIERALAYLRKRFASLMKGEFWPQASSYSLALMVLALHTLYARPARDEAAMQGDRYAGREAERKNPCGYPAWVRSALDQILDWMLARRSQRGLFRYPDGLLSGGGPPLGPPSAPPRGPAARGPDFHGPEDISNTQYVLLALWAGTRCGYRVPKDAAVSIAERLLELQETGGPQRVRSRDAADESAAASQEGARYAPGRSVPPTREIDQARGFGYTPGEMATGSMTTGGLSSLLTVKAILLEQHELDPELGRRLEQGIWDAIAWLGANYDLEANPPVGALWHYYYLYGLERALVIAGKQTLDGRDWYREGAELLLSAQRPDGRWTPPSPLAGFGGFVAQEPYATTHLDTCFALLFLKRAALTPLRPLLDPPAVVTPASDDGEARPR